MLQPTEYVHQVLDLLEVTTRSLLVEVIRDVLDVFFLLLTLLLRHFKALHVSFGQSMFFLLSLTDQVNKSAGAIVLYEVSEVLLEQSMGYLSVAGYLYHCLKTFLLLLPEYWDRAAYNYER